MRGAEASEPSDLTTSTSSTAAEASASTVMISTAKSRESIKILKAAIVEAFQVEERFVYRVKISSILTILLCVYESASPRGVG